MSDVPPHLHVVRRHLADMADASNEAEWRRSLANLVAGLIYNAPGAPLANRELHALVRRAEAAVKAGPPRGKSRSIIAERNAAWMLRALHVQSVPEASRVLQLFYGLKPDAARKRATAINARQRLGLHAGEPYGGKRRP